MIRRRLTIEQAASALGARVDEIVRVRRHRVGTVVSTIDGRRMLVAARRDANGNTGPMWLERPNAYHGCLPVYAPRRWYKSPRAERQQLRLRVNCAAGGASLLAPLAAHDRNEYLMPAGIRTGYVNAITA